MNAAANNRPSHNRRLAKGPTAMDTLAPMRLPSATAPKLTSQPGSDGGAPTTARHFRAAPIDAERLATFAAAVPATKSP
jgi:hypothetical protein